MIISHKYRFIFLKTNKTAGTSIEIALSKHCGPDDVITPIPPVDEDIRRALGYRGPQHYRASWYEYGPRDLAKFVLRGERKSRYFNHIGASRVRRLVGHRVWNGYYKFCVERNPFDRLVSQYYWCHRAEPRPPMSVFIASGRPMALKRRGFGVYTINGKVAVDRICRYESLAEDLEQVRKTVGIPEPLVLPYAKSGHRADKRSYGNILGEEERSWVSRVFSEELRMLGYRFVLAIVGGSINAGWLTGIG